MKKFGSIGSKFRAIQFLSFVFLFLFAYYLGNEHADLEGKIGHNHWKQGCDILHCFSLEQNQHFLCYQRQQIFLWKKEKLQNDEDGAYP